LVRSKSIYDRDIDPYLHPFANADDGARKINLKTAVGMALKVGEEIKFEIHLFLRHHICRRDIEKG